VALQLAALSFLTEYIWLNQEEMDWELIIEKHKRTIVTKIPFMVPKMFLRCSIS
jgi:hypothetical protein